ncbi:MAG: OsmC family protein [Gammaproteobacteria bacterium]|nr:OsmC family protein [Gammaproteobacteria bacterium]
MVRIELAYQGELRVNAKHELSSETLDTDAPLDNKGKGQSFSPTDLLATALGSCMLTIMGITAEEKSIQIEGTQVEVIKHMSADLPRRVAQLDIKMTIPQPLDAREMTILQHAAETCPVAKSIHPDLKINLTMQCL